MKTKHNYTLHLKWTGNTGKGTQKFNNYKRTFDVQIAKKPLLKGSADSTFHGDKEVYNPEDLLLSALSSCFMLSFFYLCAKHQISVIHYTDKPIGELQVNTNGSGQFEKVTLYPSIQLEKKSSQTKAIELLEEATELCFIARSCNFQIEHQANFI